MSLVVAESVCATASFIHQTATTTGPLDHCTVDSVRPGETVIRPVQNGSELVNEIVYQTVYLTAKC